jgi:Bifunctional DNA primase/polymerase, N-terminal
MTGIRHQALAYATTGWPVFPCRPDADPCPYPPPRKCECKAPLTTSGFKDATTDPILIRGWWGRWPDANVAIATGTPGPDVLDVDVKPGGSGFAALNKLKRAGLLTGASRLVRTRGGGLHIYFAGTSQECHGLRRHYVDFRSAGGYVLAPPSRIHGSPYELLDQRDGTAALDWQTVHRLLEPPQRPVRRHSTWRGGELPAGVRRALAADDTDRSAALHRLVGACLRAGMDEDAIHQLAAGYPPAVEKYGARLDAEVDRSMRRIGA